MDECHTFGKYVFDLKIVIFLLLFFALKNILVLLAKLNSGELRYPVTALILLYYLCLCLDTVTVMQTEVSRFFFFFFLCWKR